MKCSLLSLLFLLGVGSLAAQPTASSVPLPSKTDPAMAADQQVATSLEWHDVTRWGVEGRAWPEQPRLRWFDRLPAAAQETVNNSVWNLSRDSAGMMVRFKTDAPSIHVHYQLSRTRLSLPVMPATGASGVDLYARDELGRWRWVQVTRPTSQEVNAEIIRGLAPGAREYAAYLPLYNGVEFLKIGVPSGSTFVGLSPREKPIVFYGTSITHGASATRPGMVHTAILGRRLEVPVLNLGFAANGRMEAAVGEFLIQVDAAAYVIDCLPNMSPKEVRAKAVSLVRQIRAARLRTPIVLVEDRRFTNSWITPAKEKFHTENHAALRKAFEQLRREEVPEIYYIPGDGLLGNDSEGATDASHPNDLGFMRQADAMEPVLRKALGR